MPRLATRHTPSPMSGGEGAFVDDEGRLRSVAPIVRDAPGGALAVLGRLGASSPIGTSS
jgi:hypothetical protein